MSRAHKVDPRLGEALKKGMSERGVTILELAARLGITYQRISNYCRGVHLPSHQMAAMLADALSYDRLTDVSAAIRTKTCEIEECGATFIDNSLRMNRRFCKARCLGTYWMRVKREHAYESKAVTMHRLRKHEDRVRAHCNRCATGNPRKDGGVCPDADCDLREVSPLLTKYGARALPVVQIVPVSKRRAS